LEKIVGGIQDAVRQLDGDQQALLNAARGILTTDRQEKVISRTVSVAGQSLSIAGFAKGAGMIGPKMATMLGVLLTDASLTAETAQAVLQHAVDGSFNCISVEGHMSTNDTVLLLASGAAGGAPLSGPALSEFGAALREVCIELARMIPDDGEGSSHLITIDVCGCPTTEAAQQIARTVANSALVKTAIAGADPNWGRIVSAVGYAQVPFDPQQLELRVNDFLLFQNGAPVAFDARNVSASIRDHRETLIAITLQEGSAQTRFWTSDLTVDYVTLNADYHT
jgi:glutamate N-acetyltransferase/amino-acid N-acetyltransferase